MGRGKKKEKEKKHEYRTLKVVQFRANQLPFKTQLSENQDTSQTQITTSKRKLWLIAETLAEDLL